MSLFKLYNLFKALPPSKSHWRFGLQHMNWGGGGTIQFTAEVIPFGAESMIIYF